MSYGVNLTGLWRQIAGLVDKILKGSHVPYKSLVELSFAPPTCRMPLGPSQDTFRNVHHHRF
jgi:hypothetical protein